MAVATHAQGFTTLTGLIPAFAFHAVANLIGLKLLRESRTAVAAQEAQAA